MAPQLFLNLIHGIPHRCYRKTESWIQISVLRVQTDKTQNILFLAISLEKNSSEAHTLPRGRSQFPQEPPLLQLRITHSKTGDPHLSFIADAGSMGRGHVQRSEVRLLRAVKSYLCPWGSASSLPLHPHASLSHRDCRQVVRIFFIASASGFLCCFIAGMFGMSKEWCVTGCMCV